MWLWLKSYPYLLWSVTEIILFIVFLILNTKCYLRLFLMSALLSLPFAFSGASAVLLDYWNPSRLLPFWISIEDFIFAFAATGLATMSAFWPVRHRLIWEVRPEKWLSRYLTFILVFSPVAVICSLLDFKPMTSTLLPIIFAGVALIWLRPQHWITAAAGCSGFTLIHMIVLKLSFRVTPEFATSWNFFNLWGLHYSGIPLDEIMWAVSFGAIWPLFIAYLLDIRLAPPTRN
jgi:hypothetical protein